MNDRIKELITQLQTKLVSYEGEIDNVHKQVERLKSQSSLDQAVISKQKKELQDLKKKLLECSESREKIQEELRKKADELEKSNLTKEEVSQKIIQLLMIRNSFDGVRKDILRV